MGRCDEIHESLHAAICECVRDAHVSIGSNLLDIGCWDGSRTVDYALAAGIDLQHTAGVEYFEAQAALANSRFRCETLDIEADPLPFASGETDLVVCNQVFEHCKNIYRPISEIHRSLRVGGSLIFSVPNLASLHNRVLLMAGRQPTSIRVIGPHVRGFTHRSVLAFLELNGLFRVDRVVGVGFYPLPTRVGSSLARKLPHLSHTTVIRATKASDDATNWETTMRERAEQTAFFEA